MDIPAGARASIQGRRAVKVPGGRQGYRRSDRLRKGQTYGSCIVRVIRTDEQSLIPKKAKKEESK
jgi:hypothetical protein